MANGVRSRVTLPEIIQARESFTIKTAITHQMENGQRRDEADTLRLRSIIHRMQCLFEGELVVDIDLMPGISANPFFEFRASVPRSGTFAFA